MIDIIIFTASLDKHLFINLDIRSPFVCCTKAVLRLHVSFTFVQNITWHTCVHIKYEYIQVF